MVTWPQRGRISKQIFRPPYLAKFFDSIVGAACTGHCGASRVKHGFAWDAACQSTVSKDGRGAPYSLPFGFVQSPVLASLALATSALGAALSKLHSGGLVLSVYMDDSVLFRSETRTNAPRATALKRPPKCQNPGSTPRKAWAVGSAEVFNLNLSQAVGRDRHAVCCLRGRFESGDR